MYLCDLNITDELNYVWCDMNCCLENPWADSWTWHKAFGHDFFQAALYELGEHYSATCTQAAETRLCSVWRHGLIARSHSGVSLSLPCLHLIQTACSLVRFRLPKAVPEQTPTPLKDLFRHTLQNEAFNRDISHDQVMIFLLMDILL